VFALKNVTQTLYTVGFCSLTGFIL